MATKINIISGFLGAGKTTLIKKLLAGGAFGDEKLVLLENEYGEVGVDGAFMKNSGIEITELNSGCICCTLAGDFHDALIEMIDKYHPDRVIIEPSGVGKLSEVRNVIAGLAQEIDVTLEACATVADVNRCRTLELLKSINDKARIVTTPWDELSAKALLDVIESEQPLVDEFDESRMHHHHDDEDEDECECHEHDHEHEHHHDHDDDHDHDEHDHDHEHHHDHDHHHHHHHHDGEHDADEVFDDFGVETAKVFSEKEIASCLDALHDVDRFGSVIRAKGVVRCDDGGWIHFDYVPGSKDVRRGEADYTGRVCVIGVGIDVPAIKGLFGL